MKLYALPVALVLVWCSASGVAAQTAGASNPHYCMGCNFAGAHPADSDFSGVTYVGSNFAGANLEGASFRGARLVAANFKDADLRRAAFDDVECVACNFQGAKLDGVAFSGVRMVAANFVGFAATLPDAALRALLSGCVACNFQSATLAGRDLSGVPLISVDLGSADLRNAKFNDAVLCWNAIDESQRVPKCDNLKGARVDGATFSGARLCTDPGDPHTCTAVTGDTLRRASGASLAGATPP
jgi:uncharacterized protein YjbI with pentapeptide repeats